jgi:UDP-glucuronate 4-epimerase
MSRFLVTGAAGFIGMHTCQALLEHGHDIVGIDSLNAYYDPALKEARLERLKPQPRFAFERIDVADEAAMKALFAAQRFDGVVHLAAQAGVRYSLVNPMAYVQSNVAGFLNILEGCRTGGVGHLCYASSSSVYGANTELPFSEEQRVDQPISLYATTKRANELMAHNYGRLFGLRSTGLRYFTVYGPWGRPDMALFIFTRAILEGKPIRLFNGGEMRRDFTYIDDTVAATVKVIETPFPERAERARLFNVGRGAPVNLIDFVRAIEKATGRKAQIELAEMQLGDVQATVASNDKLAREFGAVPVTPIEAGVERFVAWYRSYYRTPQRALS